MAANRGTSLLNAASGAKRGADGSLASAAEKAGLEVIRITPDVDVAAAIRGRLANGRTLFIAAGGDGTVNSVLQPLVQHPEAALGVIPAGTYPGQTTDNKQMSVANILAVLDTMPNEQVTQILEVAWKGRDELAQVHSEARGFTLERQKSSAAGVPWHPAAEAFWKAQGAQLA